jgi:hypothetical protein
MPETHILLWARSLERLIVVVFAGVSLVLGWSLFKAHILKDQMAEFTGRGWAIRLQRVGPGVFFSLFGSLILALALFRPLKTSASPQPSSLGSPAPAADIEYYNQPKLAEESAEALKALNTVEALLLSKQPYPKDQEQAFGRLRRWVTLERDAILTKQFGPFYKRYRELRAQALADPSVVDALTTAERDQYQRLNAAFNDNFLSR